MAERVQLDEQAGGWQQRARVKVRVDVRDDVWVAQRALDGDLANAAGIVVVLVGFSAGSSFAAAVALAGMAGRTVRAVLAANNASITSGGEGIKKGAHFSTKSYLSLRRRPM